MRGKQTSGGYLLNIDWEALKDIENWNYWLSQYAGFGPLPGIVLAMLESFFPPLPLFAIVAGNAAAFGLWWGALFSWIGTTLGSIIVFFLFRFFSKKRMKEYLTRHPKAKQFFHWVEKKGFTPIFVLYSFPFSPSSLVSLTAGLSSVSIPTYLTAVIMGKAVVVFIMSYIGHDIFDIIKQPWRLIPISLVIFLLWYGGKLLEKRYVGSHGEEDLYHSEQVKEKKRVYGKQEG